MSDYILVRDSKVKCLFFQKYLPVEGLNWETQPMILLHVLLLCVAHYWSNQAELWTEHAWCNCCVSKTSDRTWCQRQVYRVCAYGFVTTREARTVCVCMYVCQTITSESLDIGSSYLHVQCVSTVYRSNSYMKVIWSRSRSLHCVTLSLCQCTWCVNLT